MRHRLDKIVYMRDFKSAIGRMAELIDDDAVDITMTLGQINWTNPGEDRSYAATLFEDGKWRIDSYPSSHQDAEINCIGI